MKFTEAVEYLLRGRKIRQKSWVGDYYIEIEKESNAPLVDSMRPIRMVNPYPDVTNIAWRPVYCELKGLDWEVVEDPSFPPPHLNPELPLKYKTFDLVVREMTKTGVRARRPHWPDHCFIFRHRGTGTIKMSGVEKCVEIWDPEPRDLIADDWEIFRYIGK